MLGKPSDFNHDGENKKPHDEGQTEAQTAADRLYNVVDFDRARKAKEAKADASSLQPEENYSGGFTQFPMQNRTPNYYEGRLVAGAGSSAESGLKNLFNVDRLNSAFKAAEETPNPYNPARVDGLSAKKEPPFKVPDFVPKFPQD